MKNFLVLMFILLTTQAFASNLEFDINDSVYNNSELAFIPHHGNGAFGTYLTMEVNFKPVKKLFDTFAPTYPQKLINRGEAHITVITPVEYDTVLKSKVSMDEIDQIAKDHNIQSSIFDIVCLGRGQVVVSNRLESAFFIVVNSQDLIDIRKAVQNLFIERGGNPLAFDALHYYPHITLGFSKRDLHENDGIIKDSNSCYAKLRF